MGLFGKNLIEQELAEVLKREQRDVDWRAWALREAAQMCRDLPVYRDSDPTDVAIEVLRLVVPSAEFNRIAQVPA